MNFFEKVLEKIFGDNEEDSQCGETNLKSIRRKQLELILNHFGRRKDFYKIKNEFDRRGAWTIFANYESGNAHPRYPYFQQPVTGDMTITDRGDVYEYTEPRRGIHGFKFIGRSSEKKRKVVLLSHETSK